MQLHKVIHFIISIFMSDQKLRKLDIVLELFLNPTLMLNLYFLFKSIPFYHSATLLGNNQVCIA